MATDFEREIRAAFAEVVPRGADAALATSIRARLVETTVVRRRSAPMLSRSALAAGLIAAVVIVLIGVPLVGRIGQPTPSTNPGGVGASPSVSPSPSPTASPSPSAENGVPVHKDMFGDQNIQTARLVTDTVGWVVADSKLYRTADGGRSWTDVEVPEAGPYGALLIVDADTVYLQLAEDPVRIASTHDGGATWTQAKIVDGLGSSGLALVAQTPLIVQAVVLDDTGTPARLHVYETRNGGQTWSGPTEATLPAGQIKTSPIDGPILALNEGKADAEPFSDRLWLSADGGQTWPERRFPIDSVAPAGSLKWVLGTPLVEGGRIVLPIGTSGGRDALYESTDDGQSWRLIKAWPQPNQADYGLQALSSSEWVMTTGDGSEFWSTTNGGDTWREVQGDAPLRDLDSSWASIDHGWAVHACVENQDIPRGPDPYCDGTGLKSVLFETSDGGRTWTPIGG